MPLLLVQGPNMFQAPNRAFIKVKVQTDMKKCRYCILML